MLSLHDDTTTRAMHADWRDPAWRRALEHALESYPAERADDAYGDSVRWPGEPYESVLLVRDGDGAQAQWRRVRWTVAGLTCDCGRAPCAHRARAWAEFAHDWRTLTRWARWFGAAGAVAAVAWRETGDVEAARVRDVHDVRIVRDADGTVRAVAGRGCPLRPTGRFSSEFQYGYRGAGPHELAYAILAAFYGPALAEERRRFLVEWVARVPLETREFVVPARVIEDAAHGIVAVEQRGLKDGGTAEGNEHGA